MESSIKVKKWAWLLKQVRAFLDERGLTEVSTSNLVQVGAFEASLDVLKVGNFGELHTSPEIEMKRLLAETPVSIYQICKCYRDDPTNTGIHLKEFTMLEYYRVGADCRDLLRAFRDLMLAPSECDGTQQTNEYERAREHHITLRGVFQ